MNLNEKKAALEKISQLVAEAQELMRQANKLNSEVLDAEAAAIATADTADSDEWNESASHWDASDHCW